ncbi:alpha/beta fold hydrolase [Haladaptatus sp. CMSO5]|uniref:alpha/beta fold hydrolase n=1 Tax=Haladaptatus sp. CMSO5 TaxID=3120514 RepID=UPI002FCDE5D1
MTVETHVVTLPSGEQLAYRERMGETDPVVFIHTNCSSSIHWELVFDELDPRYHLIAVDLRGCGGSSYLEPVDSIADFANDVAAFLAALDVGPVHVVGWSSGAAIGLQVELKAPSLVRSHTLISPVSTRGYPILKKDDAGNVISQQPLATRGELAADALQIAPVLEAIETNDAEFLTAYLQTLVFNEQLPDALNLADHVAEMLTQEGFLDFVYATAHFNISSVDNGVEQGTGEGMHLRAPMLVLYGTEDSVILRQMIDHTLSDVGSDAALVVLEGVGHAPAIEAPARVATELEAFFGKFDAVSNSVS